MKNNLGLVGPKTIIEDTKRDFKKWPLWMKRLSEFFRQNRDTQIESESAQRRQEGVDSDGY